MEPYKKKKRLNKINKSNFLWRGTVTLIRNCAEFALGNLQAAALVYKICLLEGRRRGKKRLSLFQKQRFSQTICKNKSSATRLYPGKPGSWAGACGVAPGGGDGEPVSTGPTRFSGETKSPRKTAPPCRPWAPIPIPPSRSEMRTWLILLPSTLGVSPLTPGSTHPLAQRKVLVPETAV